VFCCWVHDEVQIACREGMEDVFKQVCVDAAAEAGKYLNFLLPVDASAVHGYNWAETH
jgi:DNA polymerase-1